MNEALFSSATDEWGTPDAVFEPLRAEFNITLDVCATRGREKCFYSYTPEDDGLAQSWAATRRACWMNPPYGRVIGKWVAKAAAEAALGATVVALLPARTDTAWWHDHVIGSGAEVRFVRGRIKFVDASGKPRHPAPFPSAVVIFRPPLDTYGGLL